MWYEEDNHLQPTISTMKYPLLTHLSQYLDTTPAYEPRGKGGLILTIASDDDDDIEIEGELPELDIPHQEDGVNGGGFSGSETFEIPYGKNKKTGKKVELSAICTVTLTVDDWGSVLIDGETVVDLSSGVEPGGQHGGHTMWTDSGSIVLKSGTHTLSYESTNVSIPHEDFNVSICNVNLSAAWEEDGGKKDDSCGQCSGSTCSTNGGAPAEARALLSGGALPRFTTSSAGSAVNASLEEEEMRWSCSFGVLRGLGTMLSGKVELLFKELSADCASPGGLVFNHPLDAHLKLPETGAFKPGDRVEIVQGTRVVALRSYASGRVAAVGVDTGKGQATLLANNTQLQWQNNEGQKWVFSLEDGSLLEYVGANGVKVAHAGEFLQVRRDDSGALSQIWSYWDGLLQVENATTSGYRIALYTAAQVQGVSIDGIYELAAGAEAFMRFDIAYDAAENALRITSHTPGRADLVYRWVQVAAERAWLFERGEGKEAVTQACIAKEVSANIIQLVTEMSKGGVAASRVCEVYQITAQGWLCLTRVEGYGEEGALTTTYRYDAAGNQISSSRADGYWEETWYDEYSRIIKQREPWKDGASILTTDYAYANSSAEKHNSDLSQKQLKLILPDGDTMVTLLTEEYAYSKPEAGIERTTITGTADGAAAARTRIEERYTDETANAHARGQIRMTQGEDGVQTWYEYAGTSAHGALYTVTKEMRVDGAPVAGQSTRTVSYISAEGNTLREESYALLPSGEWVLIAGATYGYDINNRRVSTQQDNGRSSSRAVTCQGEPLWEVDEDGVRTSYSYDSSRQLVETIRSATPTTPETVTAYTRDAAGRATETEECIGAMKRVSSAAYDLQGREVKSTDVLGRVTRTEYSENGLKETVTTPAGAQLITLNNLAGSTIELSGDGQRGIRYEYDYEGGQRTTQQILSSGEMISSNVENGFGETVLSSVATTAEGVSLDTVNEYNAKGQLIRTREGALAPTTYAYDSMGNMTQQTQLFAAAAPNNATKNVIEKQAQSYEQLEDGVYRVVTAERNNAAGAWLTSVQKTLASGLSPTLASKQISVDERGNTATSWTEYGEGTERKSYQQIPTSSITAETTVIDGFPTSQTDNAGITTTASRRYLESGVELQTTDGRGNTTTTLTDIAERTILVTDAAGYSTATQYDPLSDNPAVITDALGNTTCYAYDVRGRKVAEYGSAVQPAVYAYDDADRLISLTTWRADEEVISTDPQGREGGDTTHWQYNDATGLLLKQTYADGKGPENTYDVANRLSESRDARGVVTAYQYDALTGNTLSVSYTAPEDVPETTEVSAQYNLLGELTSITDAAGEHSFTYNQYGNRQTEKIAINGAAYTLNELLDDYGRSIGYRLDKGGVRQCAASVGYAADGRISSAGFTHGGVERQFAYTYLPGSNLLQTLTLPNNLALTQSYEEKRDLLTEMLYTRGGSVQVTRRSYAYDALGRPYTRETKYPQKAEQHTAAFSYNPRSELTNAQLDTAAYAYNYDNIGNRTTAQEAAEEITYTANELNQYTQIVTDGSDFTPEYDAAGNQTLVKTATGIWRVTYNAQNRAVKFENTESDTTIDCAYDYMGRRFEKKVTTGGSVTLHRRYLYRGYLQIATIDLQRATQPALWYITWDPTHPVATCPLAIQTGGTWYTYGWDLTKNICEVYGSSGFIRTTYTYTPYGTVTAEGDVEQPIQWSSEYHDTELALIYYNYRYYNPQDGRWTRRDPIGIVGGTNAYAFLSINITNYTDFIGLAGVASFKYDVTYREEDHGQTKKIADIDIIAKEASKYSKARIYEIAKSIQIVSNTATPFNGKQYRYFIRFKCECDDGCFLFNIGATKPKIKSINFVVNANKLNVGNAAGNMGFSSMNPIPAEYDSYVDQEIEYRVNSARQKCTSLCAAVNK